MAGAEVLDDVDRAKERIERQGVYGGAAVNEMVRGVDVGACVRTEG
jgi:hypothetical protein